MSLLDSTDRVRFVAGLAMGVGAVLFIFMGGLPLYFGVLFVVGNCLREFYSLMAREGIKTVKVAGYPFALLIITAAYAGWGEEMPWSLLVAIFILLAFSVQILQSFAGRKPYRVSELAVTFFGAFYVAGLMSFVFLYKQIYSDHQALLRFDAISLLAIIGAFAYDTAAYFSGRLWGATLMNPVLSPKKTWEGVAGGLCGVTAGVVLLWFLALHEVGQPLWMWLVLAVAVGLAAQLGDLSESVIKREAQAKDSASWIPGHGGMLDRLASYMFVLPVGYYFMHFWILGAPGGGA
ncbi:MAG: phosphatidate cytidylyltransferase [bacterium]